MRRPFKDSLTNLKIVCPKSLKEYFSQFGQVAVSVVMYQKISGMPRGFGFVTYADPEIADKV
ncbi:hypothetical protein KY289_009034 [Solanum tuberosum]|nr:hypothetical protein KY289_009034 [Solanum tuberosum]